MWEENVVQIAQVAELLGGRVPAFVDDLRTLTAIDSGTRNKAGVDRIADWVMARCRANGWEVHRHPGQNSGDRVEAIIQGTGTRHLLLLAHMDTVYPDGTAAARPLHQEGDRLIGPGACDMKSGLLGAIYAAEALQTLGAQPWQRLTVLFSADEEIGSPETRPLIEARAAHCDAALVLEPARASGAIVAARKGVRNFVITVRGRAAHAGVEPTKGRSAVLELAHKVIALQALNGAVQGATVNVGQIQGGTAANVVPDLAAAAVDVRGVTTADLDTITTRIQAIVAASAVPDVTAELQVDHGLPPMPRTGAIERMVTQAQALAHELGFPLEAVATGGGSEASLVAGLGKPVLDGLGPIGGDAHSPSEWVSVPSIAPRTALLAGLIARLSEQGV
jgi:glutamate carboxypeptidase